jgi:hypothetical protein
MYDTIRCQDHLDVLPRRLGPFDPSMQRRREITKTMAPSTSGEGRRGADLLRPKCYTWLS